MKAYSHQLVSPRVLEPNARFVFVLLWDVNGHLRTNQQSSAHNKTKITISFFLYTTTRRSSGVAHQVSPRVPLLAATSPVRVDCVYGEVFEEGVVMVLQQLRTSGVGKPSGAFRGGKSECGLVLLWFSRLGGCGHSS